MLTLGVSSGCAGAGEMGPGSPGSESASSSESWITRSGPIGSI